MERVPDVLLRKADIKELVNRSKNMSGTSFEQVRWNIYREIIQPGTVYYFPEENTEIQVCRGETTGNWKDIGMFEGESTEIIWRCG